MKKSEVLAYIDEQASKAKVKVNKELLAQTRLLQERKVKEVKDVWESNVAPLVQKLEAEIEAITAGNGTSEYWGTTKYIDDIKSKRVLVDITSEIGNAANNILRSNGQEKAIKFFSNHEIKIIVAERTRYDAVIADLNVAQKQLYSAVKSCTTAKKAYERAKELGLDMSGFTSSEAELPAIVDHVKNIELLNFKEEK